MSEVLQKEPLARWSPKRKRYPTKKAWEGAETAISPAADVPATPAAEQSVESSPANSEHSEKDSENESDVAPAPPPAAVPKQKPAGKNTKKSQRQAATTKRAACKHANTTSRAVGAGALAKNNRTYYESIELIDEKGVVKAQLARGSTVTVWNPKSSNTRYVVWALWMPNNGYCATMALQPVGVADAEPILTAATHLLTVESAGPVPEAATKWQADEIKNSAEKRQAAALKTAPSAKGRAPKRVSKKPATTASSAVLLDGEDIMVRVAANGKAQAVELGRQLQLHMDKQSERIVEQVVERISAKYDNQIKYLQDQNDRMMGIVERTTTAAATGKAPVAPEPPRR
jgi:hypothetical protein